MKRAGHGGAGLAAAALLGLAATPGAATAQVGLEPDPEVVELDFVGNRSIPDGELAGAILTEATRCRSFFFYFPFPLCPLTDWGLAHQRHYLDPGELPRDLLRLQVYYRQRGFREARVDTLVERLNGKVRVRFQIEEGEPTVLGSLEMRGVEELPAELDLREAVPLKVGERFDLLTLAVGESRIVAQLRRRGWADATVLREYFIPAGSRRAELALDVRPGPRVRIGEVTITGAEAIGESVIWQFLDFRRGHYLNPDRLAASQRALYDLEALRYANITTERLPETDTLAEVRVDLAPAPPRRVRVGAGMSTTECGQLEARFAHRNFLGGARRLGFQGRLGNIGATALEGRFPCTGVGESDVFQDPTFRLAAEFHQPYFFSGRNRVTAGLFLERETVPDLFVRDSWGGELVLERRLRSRMPLSLGWRPEFTGFGEESADIYFCTNFGFCQPEDIALLSQRQWLSPVILTWRWDRRDDVFAPRRGFYSVFTVERAAELTGSDYEYVRLALEAAHFLPVGSRKVFATRVRVGGVEATGGRVFAARTAQGQVVHPRKRFFAGGPQSVRGFGLNLLGPTVLVVDAARDCPDGDLETCVAGLEPSAFDERPEGGNAAAEASFELRMRLTGPWSAVAFVDVGQVWEDLESLQGPVATPGIGLRYRSPVGPVRLDLGYNPTGASNKNVVAVLEGGEIQELETRVRFDPFTHDDPGLMREILRRVQLQISIGEAF